MQFTEQNTVNQTADASLNQVAVRVKLAETLSATWL